MKAPAAQPAMSGLRTVRVAYRFALRELRGGLSGFRIFAACLILGVAAIAAVGSLTRAINGGLSAEGQSILGGDIEIRLFQSALPADVEQFLADQGDVSRTARLRTMARRADGSDSALVELRAVDTLYPLYGDFITRPALTTTDLFSARGRGENESYGAAMDPLLAARLGLEVGDRITIGDITLDIRAEIVEEPDKLNLGFQFGPSLMIGPAALARSGLEQIGSQVDRYYRLRLSDRSQVGRVQTELREGWPEQTWRLRDWENSAPGFRRFVMQLDTFLILVGLAALVVGGVGVGNSVKGYMDRKTRTIATLKILGADGNTIFWTYFLQEMIIGAAAIAIGLALGALLLPVLGAFLPSSLPVQLEGGVQGAALALAGAYGLLVTAAFTLWPLGKARDLPAVRLFRDLVAPERGRPRLSYLIGIAIAVSLVAGLAVGLAGNALLAAGFLVGAAVSFALLRLTSWLIERLAASLPRPRGPMRRMAVANLHRPGAATGAVVLSLGLGLTLFAALALIEGNLKRQLEAGSLEEAPAFFLVDIQKTQVDQLRSRLESIDGVQNLYTLPYLRARISAVGGVPSSQVIEQMPPGERWFLRGDIGVSYGMTPGGGSVLVAGDWWPDDYAGPPQISLGREEAVAMGVDIGDTLTVNIFGREITAEIASLRDISFESMAPNFIILFDPATLRPAPHTYMATLQASGSAEQAAFQALVQDFPGVTAVRMKEVLTAVSTLVDQISTAVSATALVGILAGVLVLAGAIAAGFRQRVYESVILKVVGAVRRQVLSAYALEFFAIGSITAVIAAGLGILASWVVVTFVWQAEFVILAGPVVAVVASSLIVTTGFGLMSSYSALSVRPNQVLRTE